jgi:hypothetical protein
LRSISMTLSSLATRSRRFLRWSTIIFGSACSWSIHFEPLEKHSVQMFGLFGETMHLIFLLRPSNGISPISQTSVRPPLVVGTPTSWFLLTFEATMCALSHPFSDTAVPDRGNRRTIHCLSAFFVRIGRSTGPICITRLNRSCSLRC